MWQAEFAASREANGVVSFRTSNDFETASGYFGKGWPLVSGPSQIMNSPTM